MGRKSGLSCETVSYEDMIDWIGKVTVWPMALAIAYVNSCKCNASNSLTCNSWYK